MIRELAASRAPSSPPGPTPPGSRRVAFAALVLLQAALFGGMSRTLILPVLAGAAALFSLRTRERGRLSRLQFILAVGGIGAACLALWRLFPHRRPAADIDPELSAFGHALGQWALATQAALLNLDWGQDARGNPRLPVAAPLVGIPVLLTAGDIKATETERVLFLLGSVAFALLCGAFFAAGRREGRRGPAAGAWPRRAVLAAVTLAVAGSTWGASATLRRYERTMDRVIRQFLQPEPLGVSAGFTGQTTLDDVRKRKAYASDEVALRVDAGAAPGYLRGRAFYTLEIGDAVTSNVTKWIGGEEESRRRAAANLPPTTPLRVRRGDPTDETKTAFVFDFRRPPAERTAEELRDAGSVFTPFDPQPGAIDVWPASSFRGVVFAPPRTTRLLAPQPVIDADEYGLTILTPVGLPHYVCEPRADRGPKWERVAVSVDPADPRCTDVPAVFADDEELAALADRVFAGRKTPAGRIAAAESYFRRNHRYQFGADLGTTGNPLRAFLLGRRAAHCEFFATAAAVMLRTRGVPTRYVTGFVAAESNPVGGYWVARNEDAHAWCEAWDPARGWVIVEATPPGGVPGPRQSPAFGQFWDAFAAALARWRQTYTERGGWWAARAVGRWLVSTPGLSILGCLLIPVIAAAGRRWRAARATDPRRRRARRSLRRLDRRFRRAGLVRDPGEPLHSFAARAASHVDQEEHAVAYALAADELYRPA